MFENIWEVDPMFVFWLERSHLTRRWSIRIDGVAPSSDAGPVLLAPNLKYIIIMIEKTHQLYLRYILLVWLLHLEEGGDPVSCARIETIIHRLRSVWAICGCQDNPVLVSSLSQPGQSVLTGLSSVHKTSFFPSKIKTHYTQHPLIFHCWTDSQCPERPRNFHN